MKPVPLKDLFDYVQQHAINKHAAHRAHHGGHAKDAYERAVVVLRMLAGEKEWSDGYERKLDDCFEMSDGEQVCGWLIEFAEADPRIQDLLENHRSCKLTDGGIIAHWIARGHRNIHRAGELQLK